jgi:predicted ribosome quality control (RQC) complex YloA/Tae2 family protein
MEIEIDFTKSAQDNANDYFKRSKKLIIKKEGAEKAIKDLRKKLLEAESNTKKTERKIIKMEKKEWYEKFHWFYTSNDMLVIGGRDAHQNEMLNSKHFEDNDLFFHADIFGAPVVILKNGLNIDKPIREEVAQFAASYSRAWGEGLNSVDVYAMRRNQVSKSSSKGSLGTGSFLLSGERDWYRSTTLGLVMLVKEEKLQTIPIITFSKLELGSIKYVRIKQGNFKKSDAAKKIAERLDYRDLDNIMRQLPPAGTFKIE